MPAVSRRIALVSDIHSNLPATEAVARDIARRSVDAVVNLSRRDPDTDSAQRDGPAPPRSASVRATSGCFGSIRRD